jgi:hypothetical protein
MKRALTNLASWVASLVGLVATVPSCGSGIHDGEGELYVRKTVDRNGDRLVLGEAVLDVWPDCVSGPTLITLRRSQTLGPSGAISPIFQLEIPTPKAFTNDPRLSIATSSEIAVDPTSAIGHLVPDRQPQQWIPEIGSLTNCDVVSSVCGPLQTGKFAELPATKLDYAIVKLCDQPLPGCSLPNQSCQSGACQYCPTCGP